METWRGRPTAASSSLLSLPPRSSSVTGWWGRATTASAPCATPFLTNTKQYKCALPLELGRLGEIQPSLSQQVSTLSTSGLRPVKACMQRDFSLSLYVHQGCLKKPVKTWDIVRDRGKNKTFPRNLEIREILGTLWSLVPSLYFQLYSYLDLSDISEWRYC